MFISRLVVKRGPRVSRASLYTPDICIVGATNADDLNNADLEFKIEYYPRNPRHQG